MRKKYFARGSRPVTRTFTGGNIRLLTEDKNIRTRTFQIYMGDEIETVLGRLKSVTPQGVKCVQRDCLAFSQTKLSV